MSFFLLIIPTNRTEIDPLTDFSISFFHTIQSSSSFLSPPFSAKLSFLFLHHPVKFSRVNWCLGVLTERKMAAALVSQENVVGSLVSRTGRHLQRYKKGRRQVVGCIPYRYTKVKGEDGLQVLVISSQKGKGMLFPKGGWESDETITQAALRETYEEAGVKGVVERQLGEWTFQSRTHGTDYEGYMFPLQVTEVLNLWPEKTNRRRLWMSVTEARECCQHWWMKEALDVLVDRLGGQQQLDEEEVESCSLNYQAKSNL